MYLELRDYVFGSFGLALNDKGLDGQSLVFIGVLGTLTPLYRDTFNFNRLSNQSVYETLLRDNPAPRLWFSV